LETDIDFVAEQALNTSAPAFEALYRRWSVILNNYANYFLNDADAANHIVNDLFLQLWKSERNIDNIKGYLFRSVKNAALNHLARHKKNIVDYVEWSELSTIADLQAVTITEYEASDKILLLRKLISTLPEKRQLVFKMHRIEGFSYAEIADLLQISLRTVEDHLAKSMKYLHEKCAVYLNQHLTEL